MIFTADHEAGLEPEIVSQGRPQAVRTAHRIARAKQDGGKLCYTAAALGAVEKRGRGERSDNGKSARPTPTSKRGKRMKDLVGQVEALETCQPSVARFGFLI